MLSGSGWCVLRASREVYRDATVDEVEPLDTLLDWADKVLWAEFRAWMAAHETPWLIWHLHEQHNNDRGMLMFYIARNHRASPVWAMLEWIATHGPGSYGLFYVHDDEDIVDASRHGRGITEDYDNVFRVHRIMNGAVTELADPFFGPLMPNIHPPHPYERDADRDSAEEER